MAYSIGIFDQKSSNNPAQLQRQARKVNFVCHFTLQSVNNKDADETALMHRLIHAFVIFMKKMHFCINLSSALFQNWHKLILIFQIVSKSYLKNIINVFNSLDPDQAWHFQGQILV